MTITKRCFASKVQIKVKGYTNQNPEKIALAVKQMASKGWVVAEKKGDQWLYVDHFRQKRGFRDVFVF